VAQARTEALTLVSYDAAIRAFPALVFLPL
jgi:PIN domain nuclease of toxin-antitoxin system